MIARLRGALIERRGATVVIDCNGVGYEVTVSGYTLASLPSETGPSTSVTLRIFTHHNAQDAKITLFGFGSAAERELFDLLITVKNVGPSSAMGILSGGAGPQDIAQLVVREDVAGLTKIKGVGKKTAELVVVELREKCELLLATWGASGRAAAAMIGPIQRAPIRSPLLQDVASALVQLGWRQAEADKVVDDLVVADGATIESLLRQALRAMPR